MRLLTIDDTDRVHLTKNYDDSAIPLYAILSHTWGADEDEVTFDDIQNGTGVEKAGYRKIQFCGRQARKDAFKYFWVDTCCIKKSDSAELSESLNSMFKWYQNAQICYVYLADVSSHKRGSDGQIRGWEDAFRSSRWFTRGWTLQELLAPSSVQFFSRDEDKLGDKCSLESIIHEITGIPATAMRSNSNLVDFDIKERVQWASKRQTKRPEDRVYSLLGIFQVFMPPIYGEGEYAFRRLEDEITKRYREQFDLAKEFSVPENAGQVAACRRQVDPTEFRQGVMTAMQFDRMDARHSNVKTAFKSTCSWLLKHSSFRKWHKANPGGVQSPFLWIMGKPGAGKSVLMKFALAQVRKTLAEDDILIHYFFNARGGELEKATRGMYRSLLVQLLTAVPSLQALLDDYTDIPEVDNTDQLRALFTCVVERIRDRRLFCLVDALDECQENEVRRMIAHFEELVELSATTDTESHLSICFASRHYPTIGIRMGQRLILEDESGHSQDLAAYITSHLVAGQGKYIEGVREQVLQKANGVFMWVILVVDILNKEFRTGKIWAVKRRLTELPSELSDLFRELLLRDKVDLDDLKLCLQWILFSKRPLTLEDFYFAMLSGLNTEQKFVPPYDRDQISFEDMNKYLLNSSKGLAELTKTEDI